MRQRFHMFDSPKRFGLPPFYALHVSAWNENRNGAFVKMEPEGVVRRFTGEDR
jgi:hypothetical protein